MAKLAIEEGHNQDAQTSARSSKAQFHDEQQPDDELTASIVLMDALLARGKQPTLKRKWKLLTAWERRAESSSPFQFGLISGRVILQSEHPERQPVVESISQEAKRYGFAGVEFDTELALAELATKTNHVAEARRKFGALQTSAGSKGFGLIARKASHEASTRDDQIGTT